MSIWDSEIIKADGNLYAYIRVQNDVTGNISGSFRRIYKDKSGYYCKIDGANRYFNQAVESFKKHEAYVKDCLEWCKKFRR